MVQFPSRIRSCDECGLFEVRAIRQKSKSKGRARIILRGIGDRVPEILVQEHIVRLRAELPFVVPVVDGNRTLEISLAKPVVLEHFHRRRIGVRIEIVRVLADHRPDVRDRVRRENVLVGSDPHRLEVIRVLPLPSCLLDELIWNLVARELVPHGQVEVIFGSQVPLEIDREITRRTRVRKIFRNHGIQVVVGHAPIGAECHAVLAP